NDPIDESRAHQGNDGGHADSCRSHGAGNTHAYRHIVAKDSVRKQVACFAKSSSIVSIEGLVDEIDNGNACVNCGRFNPLSMKEATFILHWAIILTHIISP